MPAFKPGEKVALDMDASNMSGSSQLVAQGQESGSEFGLNASGKIEV